MARSGHGKARTVYSTDKGRLCPDCGAVKADCRCRLIKSAAPQGDGIIRLKRETKGRGGKAVTIVTGLPDDLPALKTRAKTLKQRCGVGGGVKDGVIEIQGDQREIIKTILEAEGFTVKFAGG
ncbi:translation initiation factor Sui1 [Congregibacter sp.]|uniref:translation initiation factor Sui1 n=1 Tax=Congregibacter sp. TaxID=2744308 RepID=UPI003F6D49CA